MSATAAPGSAPTLPPTLRAAVALLAAQTIAVTGLAILLIYADFTAVATQTSIAAGVTVFALAGAVCLGATAWFLYRRRAGARGPAMAIQLLLLAPAYFMINGGMPWLGWLVLAVAVGVLALLLAPATARALGIDRATGQ